jgi:DeoR family transcriptional regulator, suf operon transcriptional repressor
MAKQPKIRFRSGEVVETEAGTIEEAFQFTFARMMIMSTQAPTSDAGLLDLLRITGPLGVSELSDAMEVTPTAVRQRLVRLLSQNAIQREATRHGRGRPKHRYWLTDKGLSLTGSNFTDLAVTLWQEIRQSSDPELRRETLRRIARALASGYANQIQGSTPAERMESLAELLSQRRIPVSVENSDNSTVLTEHACPYPNLAEQDKSICNMERMMFSELVGQNVDLTQCRLDGGCECRFQAS